MLYPFFLSVCLLFGFLGSPASRPVQTPKAGLDFSGDWKDNNHRDWKISQNDTELILTNETLGLRMAGKLDGRVIRYTDKTQLTESNDDKACKKYVGTWFDFKSQLVLSKDETTLVRKPPEGVSNGSCHLSLKRMPLWFLSRVKS